LRWRAAAAQLWVGREDYAIWLRTYYGNTNAKFIEWIKTDQEMDEAGDVNSSWWSHLDDEEVFSFGDGPEAWKKVLEILPELAGPKQGNVRILEGPMAHPAINEMVRESRSALRDDVENAVDKDGYVQIGENGVALQLLATDSWLLVADKEAFENDTPLVLFLDARGNVVRQARIAVDEIDELRTSFKFGHLDSHKFWTTHAWEGTGPFSTLGEKYEPNGEIGRSLYGVEDLLDT
jgi:hypothetical protein